ncbi:hypothetical protein NA57DRAFT_56632 [Rhizodiscina lignyota]|uniref:Uncharacterized protein n=1 Tax=Rhizodiscina lignyota TaxID=1504668 RepID=A0A9P4IIE3_9PEZI|nr:hypothetical protein NA57DRAFT_56632 [Rhizodiscina lignyota]
MKFILTTVTLIGAAIAAVAPAAKPVGGPGTGTLTVFSGGTFKCANINSVIPTDGTAGDAVSASIVEDGCAIIDVTDQSLITLTMTQAPKTGTLGCYVQLFTQQGCGFTLNNFFWGQPIPGTNVGTKLGCAQVPAGFGFGGASMFCA